MLGYGKECRYAHNKPEAYAAEETYFSEELIGTQYYHPVNRDLEIKISEKLRHLRALDALKKTIVIVLRKLFSIMEVTL